MDANFKKLPVSPEGHVYWISINAKCRLTHGNLSVRLYFDLATVHLPFSNQVLELGHALCAFIAISSGRGLIRSD
jgi:hypothetical protein